MIVRFTFLVAAWLLTAPALGEPIRRGHTAKVAVAQPTRLDWLFALANQSPAEPPAEWVQGYASTDQEYELYVPEKYAPRQSWPLVLFISPGSDSAGFGEWGAACQKLGVLFASPRGAGNDCPMPRRVRVVLDVLDDVRRTHNIDPDRVYIAGFSGGGRVACAIAFALPEYFGGVIPVCAGSDLREESWLRQRAIDRLSVAQLTGETDFNRGEVERLHQTELAAVGVRCKTWVADGVGHGIPDGKVFAEAYGWLEAGLADRRKLAKKWPAARLAEAPSRDEWAKLLFQEGKDRLDNPKTLYSGLMQLKGVHARWNDLPQAETALAILSEYDQKDDRPWDAEDIAEQRRFLIARARGLDAYASGPLPQQYAAQRGAMLQGAIQLWTQVVADGQDKKAVEEARQRLPVLEAEAAK